jgi:hypothetical protein
VDCNAASFDHCLAGVPRQALPCYRLKQFTEAYLEFDKAVWYCKDNAEAYRWRGHPATPAGHGRQSPPGPGKSHLSSAMNTPATACSTWVATATWPRKNSFLYKRVSRKDRKEDAKTTKVCSLCGLCVLLCAFG